MAKSAKHKKIRRKEKAKAQLKGGLNSRLSKAQNVIEPKIQTKKILIREQLKTSAEGEITTKRQQNIQDVLSSINHHNTNIKTGALGGLYELITTQDDIAEQHLGRIVDKIGILTSDIERSVRIENLRVAEALLSQVSEDQLQPFWNLLLSHIKCTLTNLNSAVRQHCLSFIMLLVSYCPNLVVGSSNIILPSVLNLISCTTTPMGSSSSSSPATSAAKTRLKVDISDNTSQVRERIRVLSLISSCLDLQRDHDGSNSNSREVVVSNLNQELYTAVYYPFGYEDETCRKTTSMSSSLEFDMSGLVNNMKEQPDGATAANPSFLTDSEGFLPKFTPSCFPILCETWVEVAPSNKTTNSKLDAKSKRKGQERVHEESHLGNVSHLSKTAVEVLQCIANLMDHLIVRRCRPERRRYLQASSSSSRQDGTVSKRDFPKIFPVDKRHEFIEEDSANVILEREIRKSFGQDLQKYFFNFLPFSCAYENQRQLMVSINIKLFRVAAQLRLGGPQLLEKYEKYIHGRKIQD